MIPIQPTEVRYIKLGSSGRWARQSIDQEIVPLGHHPCHHSVCEAGDWDAIIQMHLTAGRGAGKAKDLTREVRDFYELGSNCLWITFADRQLWWTFADEKITWVGDTNTDAPSRFRHALGGWRNTDLNGRVLRMDELSTWLTQVANYRQTICTVKAADYLVRRLNGERDPLADEAEKAKASAIASTRRLIAQRHRAGFKTMVDLTFSRYSDVGGTMVEVALVLEQPPLGERACVRVKSKARQGTLDDHLAFFRQSDHDRTFFVCHSPQGALDAGASPTAHVWTGDALAEQTVKAGLFDWLIARAA